MNNLTVVNDDELQALAELAGVVPGADRHHGIATLAINTVADNEAGDVLPVGTMYLKDGNTPIYSKSVKIRVLAQHYQYHHYDAGSNKMTNKSVVNTSFRQEFVDEKGTLRCGKPDGKTMKTASDAMKERYKPISVQRQLRALVTYEGKDAKGDTHTIENEPCILRLKGANFMPFGDEVEKTIPSGQKLWNYWIDVSLTRHKQGSVYYYIMHFKPEWNNSVPIDQTTFETLKHFLLTVEDENKAIREKYRKALDGTDEDSKIYDDMAELEDDFQD